MVGSEVLSPEAAGEVTGDTLSAVLPFALGDATLTADLACEVIPASHELL